MPSKTRKQIKRKPLLLQALWTGPPLSRLERGALQSYVNAGYTVQLYTYNPIATMKAQVPTHVHVRDARDILPESALFHYDGRATKGKRADAYQFLPFADLFRFTMLYKKGGAWIDMDMVLLKPIPASVLAKPYVFSSERTIQAGAYKQKLAELPNIGFLKVPGPADPFVGWILDHMPSPEKRHDVKSPFDYMNLYRRAITENSLERYVLPARAFMEINWWDAKEMFDPGSGKAGVCYDGKYGVQPFCVDGLKHAGVYGVHLHRSLLRKRGLPYDKTEEHEGVDSLYNEILAKVERAA